MIKFFTNRELAGTLDVNLSKWKRWSREFLPPDPLGGMQSGYARQYHPDEAFTVYLGGHLVADLKFTIPEAKQILYDLNGWLEGNGFYFNVKGVVPTASSESISVGRYYIFISREQRSVPKPADFYYTVRGIISKELARYKGVEVMKETYAETMIGSRKEMNSDHNMDIVTMLNITDVLHHFVYCLGLDRIHYPTLEVVFHE
jgi:hypothetical protein